MLDKANLQPDPHLLMREAKAGDKRAFETLYELYFSPVFNFIKMRVGSSEAEDLCQDVFVKVYRSLPRYNETGASPIAYFFTVARNTVIDFWRKKKAVRFDTEDAEFDIPSDLMPADHMFDTDLMKQDVWKIVQTLKPASREVLTMKFIHGLSTEEIALIMQKTEEAVRQIQSRALKELKVLLQHYA